MRRAGGHRADRGSAAICQALRAYGVDVEVIGRPVDLLCGFRGQNYLLECKAVDAKPRRDQPKQDLFLRTWKGQVTKVQSVEDAFQALGIEK